MFDVTIPMWKPQSVEERIQEYRNCGFNIGQNCFIDYGVWLDFGTPHNVYIEDYVVISHGAKIIAHDSSLNNIVDFPIEDGKTVLKSNCYIGTGAIIMPNVTIGRNSVIGAGSVVTKDVPDKEVWAGNPARFIQTLEQYIEKSKVKLANNPNNYRYYNSEFRKP